MPTVLLATIPSMAGAFVLPTQPRDQQAAKSPFSGSWSADLSQSRLDPKLPIKEVDITIGVTGNVITLASTIVMPGGETIQERETLRADGTETAATQRTGLVHVANCDQEVAGIWRPLTVSGRTQHSRQVTLQRDLHSVAVRFERRP